MGGGKKKRGEESLRGQGNKSRKTFRRFQHEKGGGGGGGGLFLSTGDFLFSLLLFSGKFWQ